MSEFTPSQKSEDLTTFLNDLVDRTGHIRSGRCVICERTVKPVGLIADGAVTFRDKLSEREFTISGMCQHCQDSAYGIEENET
jgi:hypothetical protein